MVLTYTLGLPNNLVGPGIPMRIQTDHAAPGSDVWTAHIGVSQTSVLGNHGWQENRPGFQKDNTFILGIGSQGIGQNGTYTIADEIPVTVDTLILNQNSQVIDQGSTTGTWQTTTGLGLLEALKAGGGVQGGFTDADRQTLTQTQQQSGVAAAQSSQMVTNWTEYEQVTLPSLQDVLNNIITSVTATLQSGTGAIQQTLGNMFSWLPSSQLLESELQAETCSPFVVDVSRRLIVSVHIEITAYPPEWIFQTPDQGWSIRDLATIRFYRGNVLLDRQGVHTIVHTVMPMPGITQPPVFSLGSVPWLPDGYQIAVDFAEGVCGRLVAQLVP